MRTNTAITGTYTDRTELKERAPVRQKRQEIYRRIKTGTFPKQIQLGPGRVAWVGSEVDEWIAGVIERGRRTEA